MIRSLVVLPTLAILALAGCSDAAADDAGSNLRLLTVADKNCEPSSVYLTNTSRNYAVKVMVEETIDNGEGPTSVASREHKVNAGARKFLGCGDGSSGAGQRAWAVQAASYVN